LANGKNFKFGMEVGPQ